MNNIEIVPKGRRRGDHIRRWKLLFTPQATSLLLVIAVLLLAYVTTQGKAASDSAKAQAIQNKTIIIQQDRASREADLRARREAVAQAELAKDTAAALLQQVSASNAKRDGASFRLIAAMQANLLAALDRLSTAIGRLQRGLDFYAAQDRMRDERDRRSQGGSPSPGPVPTCLPPLCRASP